MIINRYFDQLECTIFVKTGVNHFKISYLSFDYTMRCKFWLLNRIETNNGKKRIKEGEINYQS